MKFAGILVVLLLFQTVQAQGFGEALPTGNHKSLPLTTIIDILNGDEVVADLGQETINNITNAYQAMMNAGGLGQPVYGLTRAFGANSELKIPAEFVQDDDKYYVDLTQDSQPTSQYLNMDFLYNDDSGSDPVVKSCRTTNSGFPPEYDKEKEIKRARAVTLLMAMYMARGALMVRPDLVKRAVLLLKSGVYPVVPRLKYADTASQADLTAVNAWMLGANGFLGTPVENKNLELPLPYQQYQELYGSGLAPVGACFWDQDGNIGTTYDVLSTVVEPVAGETLQETIQLDFYGDDSLAMSVNGYTFASMLLMYVENQSLIESAIAAWEPEIHPDSPLAEFHLDSTDIVDTSGNDYHATRVVGTSPGHGVYGYENNSLLFDGDNDRVRAHLGENISVDNEFTISAWFKTSGHDDHQVVAGATETGLANQGDNALIVVRQNGFVRGSTSCESGQPTGAIRSTSNHYNDGEWHHAAYSLEGSVAHLYIDGAHQGTSDIDSNCGGFSEVGNLWIGGVRNMGQNGPTINRPFKGHIDNVRFYDRAITNLNQVAALAAQESEATEAFEQFKSSLEYSINGSVVNPIIISGFMKIAGDSGNEQEIQKRAVSSSGFFDWTFLAQSLKVLGAYVAESTLSIPLENDADSYQRNAQVMNYVRLANQGKTISGTHDEYSPQTINWLWNFEDMLLYVDATFEGADLPSLSPYQSSVLVNLLNTTNNLVKTQEALLGPDEGEGDLHNLIGTARETMMQGRQEVLEATYLLNSWDMSSETFESVANVNGLLQRLAILADYSFRARRSISQIAPDGSLFFAVNTLNYGIDEFNRVAYQRLTKIRSLADTSGLIPVASPNAEFVPERAIAILKDRINEVLDSYEYLVGVEAYTVRTAVEYLAEYSQLDFLSHAQNILNNQSLVPYILNSQTSPAVPFRKYDAMANSYGMDLINTIDYVKGEIFNNGGITPPTKLTPDQIEDLMNTPCTEGVNSCQDFSVIQTAVVDFCCSTSQSWVQYTTRLNDLKFALAMQQGNARATTASAKAQQQIESLEFMTPTRLNALYESLYRKPYVGAPGEWEYRNSADWALHDVENQIEIANTNPTPITDEMLNSKIEAAIDDVNSLFDPSTSDNNLYDAIGLSFNGANANTWAFDNLWRFQNPADYNPVTGDDNRAELYKLMPTHMPVTAEVYEVANAIHQSSWSGAAGTDTNGVISYTNVYLDNPENDPQLPENFWEFRTMLTIDPENRGLQDVLGYRNISSITAPILKAMNEIENGDHSYTQFWDLNGYLVDFIRSTWKRWSYLTAEAPLPGSFDRNFYDEDDWVVERMGVETVDKSKTYSQWSSAGRVQSNQDVENIDAFYAASNTQEIVKLLKGLLTMEAMAATNLVEFRKEAFQVTNDDGAPYKDMGLGEDTSMAQLFDIVDDSCATKNITVENIFSCGELVMPIP